jgi:hypothetical protein
VFRSKESSAQALLSYFMRVGSFSAELPAASGVRDLILKPDTIEELAKALHRVFIV